MFPIFFALVSGAVMIVLMFALVGSYFEYKKKIVPSLTEAVSKMEAEVKDLHTKLDMLKESKKGFNS